MIATNWFSGGYWAFYTALAIQNLGKIYTHVLFAYLLGPTMYLSRKWAWDNPEKPVREILKHFTAPVLAFLYIAPVLFMSETEKLAMFQISVGAMETDVFLDPFRDTASFLALSRGMIEMSPKLYFIIYAYKILRLQAKPGESISLYNLLITDMAVSLIVAFLGAIFAVWFIYIASIACIILVLSIYYKDIRFMKFMHETSKAILSPNKRHSFLKNSDASELQKKFVK